MPAKDKLDLSLTNRLDILVDRRRFLVSAVILITIILATFIPRMQTDPSLKSGVDARSPAYLEYDKFIRVFGSEEFILVAIKSEHGVDDPCILNAVEALGQRFEAHDVVAEVVSLPNMRVFQKKGAKYGNYPVLRAVKGELSLPDRPDLERIRRALPVTDFLLSGDLKTVALLLRMEDRAKFDPKAIQELLADIKQGLAASDLAGAEYRIIGAPLIRQAIVKYSIETAVIFGFLCMLIGTVVSVYIFKSLKVTAITNIILGLCIVWILGLMSLLRIPLNSTTALSFGFIPITTLEIVIHMVVRYHQFHQSTRDKIGAVKQAVRWLARPCLICSSTTAVGFGTLMISSIPMVRQLGFMMSLGIMISYCLAFVLTPAFFVALKSLDAAEAKGVLRDWLDYVLRKCETYIFGYYRLFVIAGVAVTVVLFLGTPLIRSDIQILRMLSESTSVVKDIKFVENNLTAVTSVELMLEAEDNAFKKPEAWNKIKELQHRLRQIPEVVSTDSFLPLLEYLNNILGDGRNPGSDLFLKPEAIPQLLVMTSFSPEGERVRRRFLDENFDRLRMSVRIKNSPKVPIGKTIEEIRATADSVMDGVAKATVTGDLAVFAGQTSKLINEQILSMCLAAIIITVLMMIQLGSPMLGIVCLLPNIPPVAAVFGIMGWFGVSLDGVTIFAATVVVGLAVDNTIHYLTQLKREIRLKPDQGVEQCVRSAYRLTARQIASWSFVIMLGFLALLVSPFRPVVLFGLLGCAAIFLGFYGDLFFVQSLILNSSTIRNAITRLIEREVADET